MRNSVKKAVMSAVVMLSPFFLMAHPGHGDTDGFTVKHYIVEPGHVLVGIAVIFVAVVAGSYFSKKLNPKKTGESA